MGVLCIKNTGFGEISFPEGIIVLAAVLWLITVVRILSKDIVKGIGRQQH